MQHKSRGRIEAVEPGSPAAVAGIVPGDYLMALNGNKVADVIGYQFHAAAEEVAARAAALYQSLARIFALPASTLVLAGHATPPVAFDRQPIGAVLGTIRAQVRSVEQPVAAFVADLLGRLPPPPPNHRRIVACNEAGQFSDPEDTTLEAGGNRCAVG